MLFIQKIELEYRKDVRYANYAQIRNAIKFMPVKISKDKIDSEILLNSIKIYQSTDGMKTYPETDKQYSSEVFCKGKFDRNIFEYNIAVKKLSDNEYEILYKRSFSKEFVVKNGEYGRIVFNERSTYWDTGEWYYQLFTYNFVCCDKNDFREKIFFKKETDYNIKDMKYLRYC